MSVSLKRGCKIKTTLASKVGFSLQRFIRHGPTSLVPNRKMVSLCRALSAPCLMARNKASQMYHFVSKLVFLSLNGESLQNT